MSKEDKPKKERKKKDKSEQIETKNNSQSAQIVVEQEQASTEKIETDQTAKENPKMGRPSAYSKQLIEDICEQIATTSKGLHKICRTNQNFPSVTTLMRWLSDTENKEFDYFRELYARAKEIQAELFVEECIDIADDNREDNIPIYDSEGNLLRNIENREWVNRSRVMVDTRKWLAGKLKPKKYGDKLDITSKGEKLEAPTPVVMTKEDIKRIAKELDDEF